MSITIERGDIADPERVAQVVREHRIRRIVHLAAWQVPLCRQDPPSAEGAIGHDEQPIPFPDALDDARYQRDLGPGAATPLEVGPRRTLEEFARLPREGGRDAREPT